MVSRHDNVTLLDLLDRLLDTGVVIKGDIAISVADVDLIIVELNVLLASVSKMISLNSDSSISALVSPSPKRGNNNAQQ